MIIKRFNCDCGWAFHSLLVEKDEEFGIIAVSVVNAPSDLGFLSRLKSAWFALLGKEHVYSEIYLHRDEEEDFIKFVSSWKGNKNEKL